MRFYLWTSSRNTSFPLLFSCYVETLFDILAILQVASGLFLLWQGIQWLTYVQKRLKTDPGFYAPRTAVICPCRGMEPGLERNLVSLCEFDHQNYEIFFVLASESDPAYSTVKRVASTSRVKAHVVIAGKPENCSEKVNNLRSAVEQVPPEFEVLVFTDSDGRPGKTWLHHMVAPLTDSRIGATTTMRWFIPNRTDLATALLAAWNAAVVTMLGGHSRNFCWGGGTAIRRAIFEQIGMLDVWQYSFSDDYSLTMMIERTGRPIVFLPECLTLSYVQTDFPGLLEFTNRQVRITKVYRQKMWATGLRYTLSLLPYVASWTLCLAQPCSSRAPGVSNSDSGSPSLTSRRHPRGHPRDWRIGGSARGPRASHGPIVDLYYLIYLCALYIYSKLYLFSHWPSFTLARHRIRTNLSGTNARFNSVIESHHPAPRKKFGHQAKSTAPVSINRYGTSPKSLKKGTLRNPPLRQPGCSAVQRSGVTVASKLSGNPFAYPWS